MTAPSNRPLHACRLAGFTALFSLATLVGCGGSSGSAAKGPNEVAQGGSGPAEVGKPAPDLSIQSINGKGLISVAKPGKVLVIDFWATWCAPCKASFPQLEALSKKVGDQVEVVGISVDEEKTGVLEFARANGATFAIGWDDKQEIAKRWKVDKMPTTFIVDSAGKVRYIHASYHDGETDIMEKELAVLTEEPASGGARMARSDAKEEPKSEAKPEPKFEAKPEPKSDAKGETTASNEEPKHEAAATPKKKGPKKGGGAGGKAKRPKKAAPKKK